MKGIFISLEKENRGRLVLRIFSPCLGCCKHSSYEIKIKKTPHNKQKKPQQQNTSQNPPQEQIAGVIIFQTKNPRW